MGAAEILTHALAAMLATTPLCELAAAVLTLHPSTPRWRIQVGIIGTALFRSRSVLKSL